MDGHAASMFQYTKNGDVKGRAYKMLSLTLPIGRVNDLFSSIARTSFYDYSPFCIKYECIIETNVP